MTKIIFALFTLFALYETAKVDSLPGFGAVKGHYAGYVNVNPSTDSNIFYYFIESSSDASTNVPVTLWLNGGPGCSSLLGLFGENGPISMSASGELSDNPSGWTKHSHVIWIDQPVGTGFSYTNSSTGFPTTIEAVAEDLYNALLGFFQEFPQYSNSDFYITGESYAGHYIPALATKIDKENSGGNVTIQLKGVAIGNGWVDPITQNQAYVDYPYNLGLINTRQKFEAEAIQKRLVKAIQASKWVDANNLSNQLEQYVLTAAGPLDIDDVMMSQSAIDPIISAAGVYLNLPEVREALHLEDSPKNWTFVNQTAGDALVEDEQKSLAHLLPNLISKYRVLIYTGNYDMNCNLVGVESYLDALEFAGREAFYNAPRAGWFVNGALAGYARSWGKLKSGPSITNLIVRNAGHEVPFYQPVNALDMFRRFVEGADWF